MADLFLSRQAVRLNDGSADGNNAVITNAAPGTGDYALAVRQVGVAAAAALADNTANPTVIGVGAFPHWYDGATWDRALGNATDGLLVNLGANNDVTVTSGNITATAVGTVAHDAVGTGANPLLNGGYASAAAPTDVSADGDAVRAWYLRSGAAAVAIVGTAGALMNGDAGNGLDVDVTRVIPGTSATHLGKAIDTAAGATDTGVAALVIRDDALTTLTPVDGDYVPLRVDSTGRLWTTASVTEYVGDAAATATPTGGIVMGLANAAAPADVSANNDAVAMWLLRNGSAVVNLASGGTLITAGQKAMSASLPVVIASDQSAIAVDSELPAAASLTDNFANPTAPAVGAFLMGWDGTNWDRVSASSGRLQVDVISGGGSPPASEVPSGYNGLIVYGTTSGTAAGGTASVVTNTPANTKLFYVRSAMVAASGATKWQVKFGATVLATGFISSSKLGEMVRFDPPISGTGDGTTALTIDVTNREAAAMDLYARLGAIVQA